MTANYSVKRAIYLDDPSFVFNASHSIVYRKEGGGQFVEPLHGHDFRASLRVGGPLDDVGFVIDFLVVQDEFRKILAGWNYKILLGLSFLSEDRRNEATKFFEARGGVSSVGLSLLPPALRSDVVGAFTIHCLAPIFLGAKTSDEGTSTKKTAEEISSRFADAARAFSTTDGDFSSTPILVNAVNATTEAIADAILQELVKRFQEAGVVPRNAFDEYSFTLCLEEAPGRRAEATIGKRREDAV